MTTRHTALPFFGLLLPFLFFLGLASCGGDGGGGTGPTDPTVSSLVKVQGDGQTAEVATRLGADPVLQVNDQNGNPMSGVSVSFSVSSGGGSVTASSATTDGSGQASTGWTLGTDAAAPQELRATASGVSATFTATAVAGDPAGLRKMSGDLQTARPGRVLPDALVARVEDRFGNGVSDVPVTFSASAGSLSPAEATTDGQGDVRTTLTLPDTEQSVSVTATGPGLGAVEFQATAAETPLVITTSSLDRARETLEYEDRLAAEGGSGTGFSWSVAQGETPPGIDFQASGTLSGIPSAVGDYEFTVQVRDSEGETASRSMELSVCEEPVEMAVGESVAVDAPPPSACGIFLPSGDNGDRYRAAVLWPSASAERTAEDVSLIVEADGGAAAPPPVVASTTRSFDDGFRLPLERIRDDLRRLRVRERVHTRLLEENEAMVRRMGPGARLPDRSDEVAARVGPPARSPESRTFRDALSSCSAAERGTIDATLIDENEHVAIYQEDAQRESNPVSAATVKPMLDYYADHGKQVVDDYFGGLPDVDGNGKFFVVIAPFDPSITQDAAAFVLSVDTFSSDRCPASNEAEVTYFAVDVVEALTDQNPSHQALATLVHEAKHIVSLFNRDQFGSFHPTWVEEGTAEIAAEVSSRIAWESAGGPSRSTKLSRQDFVDASGFNEDNWGIILRMARLTFTLSSQPNALTTNPDGARPEHDFYGSAWHFLRFVGDGYFSEGGSTPADFFKKQNSANSPPGTSFIESETGKDMATLLEEYVVAATVNGMGQVAEAGPERTFLRYDFTTATNIFCLPNPVGDYPWPITTTGTRSQGPCSEGGFGEEEFDLTADFADRTYEGGIGRGGIRVHDLQSSGSGQGVELNVSTTGSGLRLVVVRIR